MKAVILSLITCIVHQRLWAEPQFKPILDDNSEELVLATPTPEPKKLGTEYTGVPRMIRKMEQTEVLFKDLKENYIIPSGLSHNRIFEAMQKSIKSQSPVTFRADPKSHQILEMGEAKSQKNSGNK